jgi:two-component system sensor histidine kinase KdpD
MDSSAAGDPAKEHAAKEHAEVLSIVSHDIRAPLGVILAALSELNDPRVGALSDAQVGLLQLVRRSSERLNRLAGNVLFLKRLTAGEISLARQATDLREVARRAVDSFERSGELGKKIRATLQLPNARVNVEGDAELLVQAATNLIANAIRAARAEVVVTVATEGEVPALRVDDDGAGVPPALLPVLFAPEAPAMAGLERGLGLIVVRGIVSAHAAIVTVENRLDAATQKVLGARFQIALGGERPRAQL